MTKLLCFFICLITISILVQGVRAEESSNSSTLQKYSITFPVAELGNCANLEACKTYCDSPQNSSACLAFAGKKGFYKEDAIIQAAKTELGCDYKTTCKEFCSKPENQVACRVFGEKYLKNSKPTPPPVSSTILSQVLQRGKELLGCDSIDACKKLCTLPENREKCSKLTSGIKPPSIGTPTSSSSADRSAICSNYCLANPQACGGRPPGPPPASGSANLDDRNRVVPGFKGPGGCNSITTCTNFCKANPTQCNTADLKPLYPPSASTGNYSQLENMCKTAGCTWTSYTCSCPNPVKSSSPVATSSANVQGASTSRNLIEQFLSLIFR